MASPILFKALLLVVKSWTFALVFILFMALGFLMQIVPPPQQTFICTAYRDHLRTTISERIAQFSSNAAPEASAKATEATTSEFAHLPADAPAATQPSNAALVDSLVASIDSYFCKHSQVQHDDRPAYWMNVAFMVIPGAFILAVLAVGLLPLPTKRSQITERLNQASESRQELPAMASSNMAREVLANYPTLALTSRQLRVALLYGVLSGVATLLVKPIIVVKMSSGMGLRANVWHLVAVAIAAVCAAVWGAYGFSKSPLSTAKLASRIGFGAIFFGSLIAAAISIPYQVLRPPELIPMTEQQVMILLFFRLLLLPVIAGLAVAALRPLLKTI